MKQTKYLHNAVSKMKENPRNKQEIISVYLLYHFQFRAEDVKQNRDISGGEIKGRSSNKLGIHEMKYMIDSEKSKSNLLLFVCLFGFFY